MTKNKKYKIFGQNDITIIHNIELKRNYDPNMQK